MESDLYQVIYPDHRTKAYTLDQSLHLDVEGLFFGVLNRRCIHYKIKAPSLAQSLTRLLPESETTRHWSQA